MPRNDEKKAGPPVLRAPDGWTWSLTAHAEHPQWRYSAMLMQAGKTVGRVSVRAHQGEPHDATIERLSAEARLWIAAYLQKECGGSTEAIEKD